MLTRYFFAILAAAAAFAQSGSISVPGLTGRIWRLTEAAATPATGSIHIFLPNGTLLQTSCVETYRIAQWTRDPKQANVLRVIEDGQLAYTAKIAELTTKSLRLEKTLVRSKEKEAARFTAVDKEFVCPDIRR